MAGDWEAPWTKLAVVVSQTSDGISLLSRLYVANDHAYNELR
jgi:hypothetical protein